MSELANPTTMRAALAAGLSEMYGAEVPAYQQLVRTTAEVNEAVSGEVPMQARIGDERHGAIRLGSPGEMAQLSRLLRLYAMFPVGLYDLRNAANAALPIVACAFRPIDPDELAANPFRLFTSMLVADDTNYFDEATTAEIRRRVDERTVFSDELMAMVDQATANGGVAADDADRFVEATIDALRLDDGSIDRSWHETLHAISPVAADIAAAPSTHLNHLTPRVLDIQALYDEMMRSGVAMIDKIQGPPAWDGPDVLLRQTSFRALDESRIMTDADGNATTATVRVRFGEVEQRGIALTPEGRAIVDQAMATDNPVAALNATMPTTFDAMVDAGLAYAIHSVDADGQPVVTPITYEDFLPASAAGIFTSNLDHRGRRREGQVRASESDGAVPAGAAGVADQALTSLVEAVGGVADPYALYAAQQERSLLD